MYHISGTVLVTCIVYGIVAEHAMIRALITMDIYGEKGVFKKIHSMLAADCRIGIICVLHIPYKPATDPTVHERRCSSKATCINSDEATVEVFILPRVDSMRMNLTSTRRNHNSMRKLSSNPDFT